MTELLDDVTECGREPFGFTPPNCEAEFETDACISPDKPWPLVLLKFASLECVCWEFLLGAWDERLPMDRVMPEIPFELLQTPTRKNINITSSDSHLIPYVQQMQ